MRIIPVINCQDFDCVKTRARIAAEALFPLVAGTERWLHIDIADGGFTNGYSTWRHPADVAALRLTPDIKIELHLMVNEPETVMEHWLAAGISRLIFHLETTSALEIIASSCRNRGVEPMLALAPQTEISHAYSYLTGFTSCQLLAVPPGLPSQPLHEGTVEKVKAIRARFPDILIEVDGGVTLEIAPRLKAAGANQIVAGSSIFNSSDPVSVFGQYLAL